MGTRLEEEGGKEPQGWSSGKETAADEECLQGQLAKLQNEQNTLKATKRLKADTIMTQMDMIEQQRLAIDSQTIALNILKRQWHGKETISRNLRMELRRAGRLLLELGR